MYSVLQVVEYEWQKCLWILKKKGLHFVWKQWKIIHSLVHIDFCITECVNSFENVVSVLDNAC